MNIHVKDPQTAEVFKYLPKTKTASQTSRRRPSLAMLLVFGFVASAAFIGGGIMGSFSLAELQSVRGKLGLPIERDLYFDPCRLSELQAKLGHV